MGYNTNFTGEITITPPLPWSAIKDSRYLPGDASRDLMFDIAEETTETAEGTLVRREATAVVPVFEDPYKGYDIVEHLQDIVDRYGAGHEFSGHIRAEGDDAGDIWRLAVVDGHAVRIQARIIWPDGTEEPGR